MKNNIIYLHKLHLYSNDRKNLSYCENNCNDKNSIFMYEMTDESNICPQCLDVVKQLKCGNCKSNENGLCDTMNAVVHAEDRDCFMHTRK